jgi:hypothetical protein
MKHGPRCPHGPRRYKVELWVSEYERAAAQELAAMWGGLSDAAAIREGYLLAREIIRLRQDQEAEKRAAV